MNSLIAKDYEILSSKKFRENISEILSNHISNPKFSIPNSFPILKRYSRLDSYTVNDIIRKELTISRIGEFNDMFDGVVNTYFSRADFENKVKKDWQLIESIHKMAGMPISNNGFSDYLSLHERNIDSKPNMVLLDHIGTFVGCFTTDDRSKLMWSHYADKNTGICISYDFNKLKEEQILKKLIFPVVYSDQPIVFPDELEKSIDNYLHIKTICSALCKSIDWKYEDEWRMIVLMPLFNFEDIRLPVPIKLYPEKICFGYHFLKKLFIHEKINQDSKALEEEKHRVANYTTLIRELLSFMIENNIKAEYVVPSIGNYNLTPKDIDLNKLNRFIESRFCQGGFYDIRFYHITQNELLDLTK